MLSRFGFGLRPAAFEALQDYSQGPVALIPALALLLILRALGASGEWGSRQVLAVGLGMTMSVLATSGFVQAMSRRASICLAFNDIPSVTRFLRRALALASTCVMSLGLVVVLIASRLDVLATQEVVTFGLAFVGLSTIWLLSAGLSLVRASAWLGVGLLAGLVLGVAVDTLLETLVGGHLAAATLFGFLITIGVLVWVTRHGLRHRSGGVAKRVALPRASYLISEAAPYFAYGALYSLLLFVPHVIAWLAALGANQSRLWAVASVEAGFTLALPPVILAGGIAQHTVQQFWKRAAVAQINTSGTNRNQFRLVLRTYYRHQLVLYLIVLSAFTVVAGLVFRLLMDDGILDLWLGLGRLDVFQNIFLAGLIAYWFLGWGMFNCMLALSLARPRLALRPVVLSLACTVIVGAPSCFLFGFGYAGVAAIAGSVVYVVASARTAKRLFGALDYYYASAF